MMSAVCATPLAFVAQVELRGEILHLGDVADLSSLPDALAARADATALLRVDRGALHTAVARHDLAVQVGARLPFLAGCFAETGGPVVIRRQIAAVTPRAISPGPAGFAKGEQVAVRIVSGTFAIERTGTAGSDAKPGGRMFVRTSDGQVIRAVVEGATP